MNISIMDTCKEILELEDNFELDMSVYYEHTDKYGNTSYCIAGRLAYLDGYPKAFYNNLTNKFDYLSYSLSKLGDPDWKTKVGSKNPAWVFLFEEEWPNSLNHAERRAQYLLDNQGQVPDWFYIDSNYHCNWEALEEPL